MRSKDISKLNAIQQGRLPASNVQTFFSIELRDLPACGAFCQNVLFNHVLFNQFGNLSAQGKKEGSWSLSRARLDRAMDSCSVPLVLIVLWTEWVCYVIRSVSVNNSKGMDNDFGFYLPQLDCTRKGKRC